MILIKKCDVKNHLAARRLQRNHLNHPNTTDVIAPKPAENKPATPGFSEDFCIEHSLRDADQTSDDHGPEPVGPRSTAASRSASM
jgi:hypothetical protein